METIIQSRTRTVLIGPERPFTIIGERINPTGRKLLAPEMAAGDLQPRPQRRPGPGRRRGAHARRQRRHSAGRRAAHPGPSIQLVQSITDVPLSIDSSIVAALEAGWPCTRARRW
jgi:5-methyltetrahydrofolate--homocysteine methyltransferase